MTLLPDQRGHGTGTKAHLFRCTRAHRLEAFTDDDNVAEQRVGFHREGLLCQAVWRDGANRDVVVYGRLREG